MKKLAAVIAALVFLTPGTVFASKGSMSKTEHMAHMGGVAHEEVVEGIKVTFKIMNMAEHLKAMKVQMPKGMKETHHLAVEFKDAKTGRPITKGEGRIKIQGPDKSEQVKNLMGMQGHFGADIDLSRQGRYGVMCKIKLEDGKVRQTRFWYEVK